MKRTQLATMLALFLTFFVCAAVYAEEAVQKSSEVTDGNTVKVLYTLTVDDKVIDKSINNEPFEFKVGDNQVVPGFEDAVKGMKLGEKKSFKLSPADGYGEIDPEALQEIPLTELPAAIVPTPGMTLQAMSPEGQTVIVTVKEVKKDTVVMDFNHPLAGKTLNFDVEVVGIL
ncbi:MAG: peptidylprolyl isomerase [Thermodesulfovibrionia bacterium]|nr:peptidylprolyl isomerase [Thermodesulfovibrionia bacterium]